MVGNPCNTNALIAMENAPNIPRKNFHALTRLDENRAKCQLALKSGKFYTSISRMAIWGNHSTTQVRLRRSAIFVASVSSRGGKLWVTADSGEGGWPCEAISPPRRCVESAGLQSYAGEGAVQRGLHGVVGHSRLL